MPYIMRGGDARAEYARRVGEVVKDRPQHDGDAPPTEAFRTGKAPVANAGIFSCPMLLGI
jgi:hypothetical protein